MIVVDADDSGNEAVGVFASAINWLPLGPLAVDTATWNFGGISNDAKVRIHRALAHSMGTTSG